VDKSVVLVDYVVIVEYNENWPAIYERERQFIVSVLGDAITSIEHIGSTAVPGLSAKPTIDLMLLVERLAPEEIYACPLKTLGYIYVEEASNTNRYFLKKGEPRAYHLHIVECDNYEHRRLIAFRDYLRLHPRVREEYEALKKALALKFCNDRKAYTNAKTEFIRSIEARIL
jgi:GrpB-like predicted nucleotidyltransferase (UPF0157 family)